MLNSVVMLPSALRGTASRDAALMLLMDVVANGQLLVDIDGHGQGELVNAVANWGERRTHGLRLLKRLADTGRIVTLRHSGGMTGCTDGCNGLRAVARDHRPMVAICGGACCAELGAVTSSVDVASYVGSPSNDRLRQRDRRSAQARSTEDWLEAEVLVPILRYAQSATIFDRQIGRSLQDERVPRWRVKEGFDRTIRFIANAYMRESRVPGRSIRIVTGLWSDRDFDRPLDILMRWEEELRGAYPAVQVSLVVRGEQRREQLDHDRYLVTNQIAMSVSRGFDLLFSDREMTDKGLDPARHPRPIHSATFAIMQASPEALADANDLEQLHPIP
jgi:hypothetical protein